MRGPGRTGRCPREARSGRGDEWYGPGRRSPDLLFGSIPGRRPAGTGLTRPTPPSPLQKPSARGALLGRRCLSLSGEPRRRAHRGAPGRGYGRLHGVHQYLGELHRPGVPRRHVTRGSIGSRPLTPIARGGAWRGGPEDERGAQGHEPWSRSDIRQGGRQRTGEPGGFIEAEKRTAEPEEGPRDTRAAGASVPRERGSRRREGGRGGGWDREPWYRRPSGASSLRGCGPFSTATLSRVPPLRSRSEPGPRRSYISEVVLRGVFVPRV